jgi:dihydrofolate reductase
MRKVTIVNNLSLDGVIQAPGRPDEDVRGGFEHGGWAVPYNDEVKNREMAKGMAKGGALLFGRRTYEDFAAFWPNQKDNPFTEVLNNTAQVRGVDDTQGPVALGELDAALRRRR